MANTNKYQPTAAQKTTNGIFIRRVCLFQFMFSSVQFGLLICSILWFSIGSLFKICAETNWLCGFLFVVP
jgi:hypothetical protein